MDQAAAAVRDSDPRAALDAAITAAQDVDLQAALDKAVEAASQIDLQAALGEVVDRAQAIDLQAAVEQTLGSADVDVRALLADGVETTRTVTASAQAWLQENADVVCTGSSLGVGAAAAAVVVHLTGSPGLAIAAFQQTERLSNDACGDIAQ
jgi:chromosome condensin MukBEF ATPase and DNA-binding subunit MukB